MAVTTVKVSGFEAAGADTLDQVFVEEIDRQKYFSKICKITVTDCPFLRFIDETLAAARIIDRGGDSL